MYICIGVKFRFKYNVTEFVTMFPREHIDGLPDTKAKYLLGRTHFRMLTCNYEYIS